MNKKLLTAVVLAGMCVAAVAGATPMTEFHKGEGQIDVAGWQHGSRMKIDGNKYNGESKIGFVGSATYGIAEKWGLQYGYHDLTTGNIKEVPTDAHLGGYQHEINALYSFAPNAAGYIGWNQIHGKVTDSASGASGSATNNIAQLGVVAKTPLADKLDLYGNFAVGTKSTLMGEAGLGYALSDKLDVNAGYRYLKTDLADAGTSWKGFFLGLTGKFGKPAAAPMEEEYVAPMETAPVAAAQPSTVAAPANDYYFNSIHFDFDKDNIRADQVANADSIVNAAKQTGHVFKLVGNTDGLGSNAYNDDLSKRRVDRVAAYVKSRGIPASQIVTQYKGKNAPASSNDTEAGRAANRRVDVFEHK